MLDEILLALSRCRVIEVKNVVELLEISEEAVDDLLRKGLIKKEAYEVDKKKTYYLQLSDKGESVVAKSNKGHELYRGFIMMHDLRLSEFYASRTKAERDTWLTKDDLIKKHPIPGVLDGAFMNALGQFEGIEVMSKTANPATVMETENFVKEAGIEKMNYIFY